MGSAEITWQIVPNTVESRMLDFSMTHKLIPSRKMRRRSKATNNAIKHTHNLKAYKQYIKIKTSLLRNISDDKETDGDSSFTDDDYSIAYKSDLSLSNYLTEISKKNKDYFHDVEIDTDEYDIMPDTESSKLAVQTLKANEPGLRRVLKKRGRTISNMNDHQRNGKICLKSRDSEKLLLEPSEESNVDLENNVSVNKKVHVADNVVGKCVKNAKPMACDTNPVRRVTKKSNQFVQAHPAVNGSSQRLPAEEDNSGIMSRSIEIPIPKKGKKKNWTSVLDNTNDVYSDIDFSTNQKLSMSQNDTSRLNLHENARETSAGDTKNGKLCEIQSLIVSNSNQPKDSGIEEDIEEESQEHEKKHYSKIKNKRHKAEGNAPINFPHFASDKRLTDLDDTLICEGCNLLNETNCTPMSEFLNKSQSEEIECPEEMVQKHKLQPKVTHTEIVRRKYKIVMCNACSPINTKSPSPQESSMQDLGNEVIHEIEEIGEKIEDNVSLSTKKRLSQLKRLNLIVDSDSSLSDNENTKCTIENTRDKLLKRSKVYSEFPNCDDIDLRSEHNISIYDDNKFQNDENLEIENSIDRKNSSFVKKNRKEIQNEKSLKQTSCSINKKGTLKKRPKVKHALLAGDNIISQKSNLECDGSRNFDQGEHMKELDRNTGVQKTLYTMQSENGKVTTRCRPCNLQELVEEGNLVLDRGSPTFTLEDIGEHELFIIDIPSVMFDRQLVGKKIVLTEKKLRLGNQKYKVEYKNVDNVTCVFANRKSHRPYKLVNVKPFASVVAHQRLQKDQKNLQDTSKECSLPMKARI